MVNRAVAAVLVLALAAACGRDGAGGGAGGGGEAGGEELSREEYLERADEICRRGNDELEKASQEAFAAIPEGQTPTPEQFQDYARNTVVPMVRGQVEELRDLPPPEGGAAQVTEIYDAIDEALDELEENPSILTRGGADLFAEADELSRKYGYEVCAGGSPPADGR